jgi:predicted aspartyl protease
MDKVGIENETKSLAIVSKYAIIDTGVSYSIIPSKDFNTIYNHLMTHYNVLC